MKKHKIRQFTTVVLVLLIAGAVTAATAPIERPPSLRAGVGIGFNYDLLRPPTAVSFEYPKAFVGLDIPIALNASEYLGSAMADLASDTTIFREGTELRPEVTARQNANTTIRVDVPMMGGVCSFSNTENFYFDYFTFLGNPDIVFIPESGDNDTGSDASLDILMRGTLNVPLELSMKWESITFGYAYQVNKDITFAFNLHRHLFNFDVVANVKVDILGNYSIDMSSGEAGDLGSAPISGSINYPSTKVNGVAVGDYKAEVWTPTLGVDVWRVTWTSRFGFDTEARGSLHARYALPFFLDPEDFGMVYDFNNQDDLLDPEFINGLQKNATDSIRYDSDEPLKWAMPSAHTIAFDIIPDKLNLSYTKFFGEVAMSLDGIKKTVSSNAASPDSTDVGFDIGVSVDHVIMLSGNFHHAFFNLGVFAFDFRVDDRENLLGSALKESVPAMTMGKSAMLPILNFGTKIGSRFQLLLELDVLPMPALKTGLFYNF